MRLLKHIYSGLAAVVAIAMLASCSSVIDDGGVCPENDSVVMSFRMLTSAPMTGTRADGQHTEVDSEYREFEDGININDFAFFIFVGEGDDAKLVVKNTNIASSTDPTTMITGSPGAYTVTVKMNRETLDAKLGHPIKPGSTEEVKFRFLIFANCYSPVVADVNPDGGGRYDALAGETFGEVVANAAKWGFAMSEIYSPVENDSPTEGLYKGNIPMYGTNNFTVTEGALYASRPDERIYLGEIDLLRALAKVRVVDNIPQADKDAYGYPRIEWVEFIGTQDFARQLPYDAGNYINGNQTHTPNIFNLKEGQLVPGDAIASAVFKLGTIPNDWTSPVVIGNVTRIGYVPEQVIANVNGNIAEGLPIFRITVGTKGRIQDGNVVTAETETYDVPMTGYEGQAFEFGGHILRNHIYTLSVNQVKLGVPADITLSVVDWNEQSLILDYTNNVNVSDPLTWTSGFDAGNNDTENGIIVMSPWHDGQPVPLIATFGISTPLNAVWTAELLVTEGQQGAFKFMLTDENGNESQVDRVSGTIDGKTLSTIRIVSTNPTPAVTSQARLAVTVRLADGTYMEAPLCGEHGYKNYTIIQNQQ